jgi:hypothetical protein
MASENSAAGMMTLAKPRLPRPRFETWRRSSHPRPNKRAAIVPAMTRRATRPFLPNDVCASSAKIGAEAKRRYGTASRSHATRPIPFVCAIANETAPSAKKATETARRGRASW